MKTRDFSHFIEKYNSGEMSEEEKNWFCKELEGNMALRDEVELRRRTDKILHEQDVMELRSKLAVLEGERRAKEAAHVLRTIPEYFRYAAAVAVLVAAGGLALYRGGSPGADELISKYYRIYEAPASQRSASVAGNTDFELAVEFYNTSDFANAAKMFSRVIESDPHDMQSVLLYGVSSFEEKQYPEAKKSFSTVIDDNNNLFIEDAKWYLALCYLRTREEEKALSLLRNIRNDGGSHGRDAARLLKKIK